MSFRFASRFVLAAALAVSAFAADVSGKWKTSMTTPNGDTREGTLTLKAEGEKLTGTMEGGRGGAAQISDGKVSGDDVSFSVVRNFNGNEMKLNYKGKVAGDTMKITVDFNGREMTMTAKRAE